ncbi:type IV conjugative transfer system coupling protein TraD [Budviciaceae bacterium BWR-B9]|uniref:Type IV conjugative transfer system coupling protein TraD n=1 Tax=Limnobaculum allomyrinae TaxID=2791986 RepID=A0ABS1IUT8_9GAMM|nr:MULTISPECIES: type IV conjugative transfer system coupling protein TraD [Limnobaculum]MBK5145533.1 type IV conjugative transfer system coupling protein TraD [Limnobaculum allomyrinae]MBV7693652.1 type IV conjugative transfer system coupling protein TraD [Limnobaculum sp. M2-1]
MSFNMKDMTQGGQLFTMRLRMFGQIMGQIVWVLSILFISIVGISLYFDVSKQNFFNGMKYWWCWITQSLSQIGAREHIYHIEYYGYTLKYTAQQVLNDAYTTYCGELIYKEFISACLTGGIFISVLFLLTVFLLGREGKQQSEDEITGGRTLTDDPKAVTRLLKKLGRASSIMLDKLALVKDSEVQNFSVHGTVGSGKSRAFRAIMKYARKRGDLVIVYDKGATFVKEFYDPATDHILNPLDKRCANWDLWSECLTIPEYENYASSLIPSVGDSADPFWQGSARTIFTDGAHRMKQDKDRSYWRLLNTLLSISLKNLRAYLQNTPSANLVASEIEKTAISIRGVLTNYVKALRYLVGIEKSGPKFTIRDWMRDVKDDGRKNGWLFITSDGKNHSALKPVISAWLSVAIKNLLAMGENADRRVWFFLDELPTLHRMPDLVETIAETRKFGGCFVLGFQSYAQLEEIYGVKNAAAMFDTLNTRFFFRNPSKEIAKWVAEELGEKERFKACEQFSYGADSVRDGVSVGKDEDRTQLVSYSNIQSLDNLECYVTLPGPFPVVKMTLKYEKFAQVAEGFEPRAFDMEAMGKLNQRLAEIEAESKAMDVLFTSPTSAEQPVQLSDAVVPPPVNTTSTSTAASNTAVSAHPAGASGGREQNREMLLPPGVDESGEITDMALYEEYADQQELEQQKIARREEINISHSQQDRGLSGDEPGERLL